MRELHRFIVVHRYNDVAVSLRQRQVVQVVKAIPEGRTYDDCTRGVGRPDNRQRLAQKLVPELRSELSVRFVQDLE